MSGRQNPDVWKDKRRRAVRTALLLGVVAALIFVAFIASGVIGR